MKQLFPTSNIVMTRGVSSLTRDFKEIGNAIRPTLTMQDISECLQKHFMNEGEESASDKRVNAHSIKNLSGMVLSVFYVNNIKLYVITDGLHLYQDPEYGKDYPLTTVLLPEEY